MKADAPGESQTLKPRCSNQPSLPHSRSKIRHASHQATQIYEKCKSCLVRYSLTSTHRPTSPDRPGDPGDPPRYRICVSRLYQALSRLGLARVGFTTKLDDSKTSPPVVVFHQPICKNMRKSNLDHFPMDRGEHKTCLKPPPRSHETQVLPFVTLPFGGCILGDPFQDLFFCDLDLGTQSKSLGWKNLVDESTPLARTKVFPWNFWGIFAVSVKIQPP